MQTEISLQFCTGHGQFDTHKDMLDDYAGITYDEIVAMVGNPQSVDKAAAQWLIPSCYRKSDARSHDAQRIRGQFGFLTVDVDQGNLSIDNVKEALKAVLGNCSMVVYSTRSATAENRKWRVLVPLKNPVAGADYADTSIAFYDLLTNASKGILIPDRALARPGQLVYLPNRGAFYEYAIKKAAHADLNADHPIIVRRDGTLAARAKLETAARDRKAWKAQNIQTDAGSLIDEFNASTTICRALAHHGYVQAGQSDDWRSPMQTSGSFATRAFADHWISLSGSDAAAGIGRDSKTGQRFGDAFDLYVHFEHRGDFKAAVRAYAQEIEPLRASEKRCNVQQ